MKKLLLLMSLGLFLSCSNVQHSDYERNLEITKEWFETFGNEDLEVTMSYFADEIEYQSAFYGGPLMNKAETTEYYKGWHDAMEGITYEAQNYLPGVDPDTGLLNGSVRTYGHWSGTKSDSGKTFKGLWYHYLTFDENGKIINGGDFGDATGLIMSVMPDQE
jgi:ketosteroid isomerase-like protein